MLLAADGARRRAETCLLASLFQSAEIETERDRFFIREQANNASPPFVSSVVRGLAFSDSTLTVFAAVFVLLLLLLPSNIKHKLKALVEPARRRERSDRARINQKFQSRTPWTSLWFVGPHVSFGSRVLCHTNRSSVLIRAECEPFALFAWGRFSCRRLPIQSSSEVPITSNQ